MYTHMHVHKHVHVHAPGVPRTLRLQGFEDLPTNLNDFERGVVTIDLTECRECLPVVLIRRLYSIHCVDAPTSKLPTEVSSGFPEVNQWDALTPTTPKWML